MNAFEGGATTIATTRRGRAAASAAAGTPASTNATSVAAGPTGDAGSANVTTVGAHMVHSEGTVASGPSRLRVHLLLGIVLAARLAGAAADEDPCARPCGRAHTCGELNVSFTCDILSTATAPAAAPPRGRLRRR